MKLSTKILSSLIKDLESLVRITKLIKDKGCDTNQILEIPFDVWAGIRNEFRSAHEVLLSVHIHNSSEDTEYAGYITLNDCRVNIQWPVAAR